jgi:hypothetical protein
MLFRFYFTALNQKVKQTMKKFFLILIIGTCFQLSNVSAQAVTQTNAWFMYFGNHRINEKFGLHTEYQFRRSDFATDWQQSLMRIGLDYYLPNKAMATAGYGWIVSFPYGEYPIAVEITEHRIWEQFVLNQNIGRFYFNHRYRLEQRFIENASLDANGEKVVDGYNFRQRARYRFLVTVPITRKTLEDNTLFFAAYDEPFLGFGKGIQKNILDQNRLYFALGWRFDKDFNVQLGYLNQRVIKSDGVRIENNNTFQLGVTYNLDLRESK